MLAIRRRDLRYAVPAAVAGAIALGAAVPALTAGASTPDLPPVTAQALIAQVDQAHLAGWSGTLTWTADLGLPSLGGLASGDAGQVASSAGFDPTSLLSGTHSIEVWTAGDQQRLALPRTMGETDFIRVGTQAWLYDSATQHVTHFVPGAPATPAGAAPAAGAPAAGAPAGGGGVPAGGGGVPAGGGGVPADGAPADGAPLTPDQVAAKLLGDLGPSTDVTVNAGPDVAGQHAYLLILSPKAGTAAAGQTTLQRVTISVDAANGLPLGVAVYANGMASAVASLAYNSISFATPSASEFVPPTGTSTSTQVVGHGDHGAAAPDGSSAVAPDGSTGGASGSSPGSGPSVSDTPWAWIATFDAGSSQIGAELNSGALAGATTAVSGKFGTGRLLTTNIVNVLILPDGRILAGFVTPAALEAAAALG